MELVVALVGAIGATLAAVASAVVGYLLGLRGASDKSVLQLWRMAFDRSAFKGPYLWHSDQAKFKKAIEQTIQCLNTGVLVTRHGKELGRAKAKSQIRNKDWRLVGDATERKLNKIRQMIPETLQPNADIASEIDRERDDAINSLNCIWKRAGIPVLPVPTDVETYEDVSP